ncbi:MAG: hypothetical protein DHS20C19_24900 [Acidimicrobiales bacterium]|nr:MAG: hypothetical protein DHS20C19_24900 [Acidimicrobiales bacterium]
MPSAAKSAAVNLVGSADEVVVVDDDVVDDDVVDDDVASCGGARASSLVPSSLQATASAAAPAVAMKARRVIRVIEATLPGAYGQMDATSSAVVSVVMAASELSMTAAA